MARDFHVQSLAARLREHTLSPGVDQVQVVTRE